MKTKKLKILIADDHALFRNGLVKMIESFDIASEILQVENGQQCLDQLNNQWVDVVLLDIQMPVLSGFDTIKLINKLPRKPYVIILTQFEETSLISYMLAVGARAYLLKKSQPVDLLNALLAVPTTEDLESTPLLEYKKNTSNQRVLSSLRISSREYEVMNLLKDGKSNKEIAQILNLTVRTVESYRKSLMKKTGCKNVADVISLAFRSGLVSYEKREQGNRRGFFS